MEGYLRKIHYHETDKMQVTHHSNYIKFMEEARVDYLDKLKMSYADLEKSGICSFVVSVSVDYKKPSTFGDELLICMKIKNYTGVRFEVYYEMTNTKTNEIVCTGTTLHCFADLSGKIVSLKKVNQAYHELFQAKWQESQMKGDEK